MKNLTDASVIDMENKNNRPNGQQNRGFSTGQRASSVGGRPSSYKPQNAGRPSSAGRRPAPANGGQARRPQQGTRPQGSRPQNPGTRGSRPVQGGRPTHGSAPQRRPSPQKNAPKKNTGRRPANRSPIQKLLASVNRNGMFVAIGVFLLIVIVAIAIASRPENPAKLKASDSPVYISEYMSKNSHFYDEKMKTHDWVELYNPANEELSLSGYKLVSGKEKIKLGGTISAKGYSLVYLDSAKSFALDNNAESEQFWLKDKKGKLVDLVTTKKIKKNHTVIRSFDSKDKLTEKESKTPTPGFANTKKGYEKYLSTRRAENKTGLVFNEVMASNKNIYVDEFGDTVDYVEILNTSDKTVNLSGYGVTDDESDPFAYQFPDGTKLGSGELILINCSSDYKTKDENGEKILKESKTGANLAAFGLKNGKESVYISNPKAQIIEKCALDIAGSDQSIVRDEEGKYSASYYISPGYANTSEGIAEYNSTVASETDLTKLYISEAMSKNSAYIPQYEKYYDWVELYNPADSELNLDGYMLSNDRNKPDKFVFSGKTIPAKGYLVVYCTDKKLGVTNTGFNLNGGCACYLFSPDKKIMDKVTLGELITNVSKGRVNGDGKWKYFSTATPGEANSGGEDMVAETPKASKPSGQYNGVDSLEIELSADGAIYYTTNGSAPSKNSTKYSSPIKLTKTTVVRAVSYSSSGMKSAVSTYSYIINENHKMDVVMVASDPDGLFSSSTGIYAMGSGASGSFPYFGANFWQRWKRQANISLIPNGDKEEGFSIDGETSIFGGYSRGYEKKSLKFKFKDVYGAANLNYPLFENRDFSEYDSLVLRPCGQDVNTALMRDDLITTLADEVVDVMASRPVVLYINGEYYGIYYIREKINAKFVASHYNVSESSVDLLQSGNDVNAGSRDDWQALMDYVKSHDISQGEGFKYVESKVDLQNLADYVIAEMYCGNTDGGNIRYFRSTEGDGKWRWILYDTDYGLTKRENYSFYSLINPNQSLSYEMFPRKLLCGLLKNKKFRDLFVSRLEYQMNHIWNSENLIATIDMFADRIADEIPRNHQRWNITGDWSEKVEVMRTFAKERQAQLKDEFANSSGLRSIIALTDEELNRCFEH